jgi:hypothetical protein
MNTHDVYEVYNSFMKFRGNHKLLESDGPYENHKLYIALENYDTYMFNLIFPPPTGNIDRDKWCISYLGFDDV